MRKLESGELNRPDSDTLRQMPRQPFAFVLDNVRSALNVGSVFRTCDGFALDRLLLCGITAQPPHREILKTALGATATVAWAYFGDAQACIARLAEEGREIVCVEQTDSAVLLGEYRLPDRPLAFVFGNEVEGVSQPFLDAAAASVEIPQFGAKHSLNVAVCAGILAWEISRQRGFRT